jgi:hypothetical protein
VPRLVRAENVAFVPVRVPFWGDEGRIINSSIPELDKYLKSHYGKIEEVRIWYRNPRPEITALLHEAYVVVTLFNPFSKRMLERLGDDIYDWMKGRSKRVRKGHTRKRTKKKSNRRDDNGKPTRAL